MRIRKNAKLSSLMLSNASGSEVLQTHVCQLNQSPWDAIPFSQDSYQSSLQYYEGEDSFNGNGSLGDSIGAVESSSAASLMEDDPSAEAAIKIKVDNMVIVDDDNYEIGKINQEKKRMLEEEGWEFKKIHSSDKTDGKGWHCKNEQKYNNNPTSSSCITIPNTSPSIKKPEKPLAGTTRRGRAKGTKKGQASSSNPYEFYYYSGFGPLWGKRRGDKSEGNKNENKETEVNVAISNHHDTTPFSTPSPIEHREELDFMDEEDDDDDDEDTTGKKRMRKPVKARSLKSLM